MDISVMPPGAAAKRAVRSSIRTAHMDRTAARTPATSINAASRRAGTKERIPEVSELLVILSPTNSPMATCSIWFTTWGDATGGKFSTASPPPTPAMVPTKTPAGTRKRRPKNAPTRPRVPIKRASTASLILRLSQVAVYSVPSRSELRNVSITFGIKYGKMRIARAKSKSTRESGRVKNTVYSP